MQGRNIGRNMRKVIDIMEYADTEQIDAVLISLDFEKPFDRVEISAFLDALRYHNIGENFVKWITLLHWEF